MLALTASFSAHAHGGPAMMGLVFLIAAVWVFLILPFSIGVIVVQLAVSPRWPWLFWLTVPAWFVVCSPIYWMAALSLPALLLHALYVLAVWQGVAWAKRRRLARLRPC